jgi:hypothetical protein
MDKVKLKDFSLLQSIQTGSGATHPPIEWLLVFFSPMGKAAMA